MSRFGKQPASRHLAGKAAAIAASIALTWAFGEFQQASAQDRTLMLGGVAPSAPLTDSLNRAPATVGGLKAGGAEPRELAGMLQQQNEVRHRAGAPALSWSNDLAANVRKTTEAAMQPICSQSAMRRTAAEEGYAAYWAAPMRRMDSATLSRMISAPYIVSEWNSGAGDYDAAKATCRRGGSCDSYRAMVAPKARLIGCVRVACSNGAQVFACGYAPSVKPR